MERGCGVPLLEQTIGAEDQVRHRVTRVECLGVEIAAAGETEVACLVIAAEKAEDLNLQRYQASVPGVRREEPVDVGQGAFEVGARVDAISDAGDSGLEIGGRSAGYGGCLECAATSSIKEVEKILTIVRIIKSQARILDKSSPEVGLYLAFVAESE